MKTPVNGTAAAAPATICKSEIVAPFTAYEQWVCDHGPLPGFEALIERNRTMLAELISALTNEVKL
jgi:hypothetical protein